MTIFLEEKTKTALKWIVGILNANNIPFQISGGFAAKLYGSPRPLNDIDVDIPREGFEKIRGEVKDYITYGPTQLKDKKWDLYLMTLNYGDQEIDIGDQNIKIYNNATNTWLDFSTDFSKGVPMEIEGTKIFVMPKNELVWYKKYLDGDHQIVDINAVNSS